MHEGESFGAVAVDADGIGLQGYGAAVVGLYGTPVSYTHLDVYKRQPQYTMGFALCADASGLRNLVGFLVNIVDRRNVAAFLNDCLLYTSRCV